MSDEINKDQIPSSEESETESNPTPASDEVSPPEPSTAPTPASDEVSPPEPSTAPTPASDEVSPPEPSTAPTPASDEVSPPEPSTAPTPASDEVSPPEPSTAPTPASDEVSPPEPSTAPTPASDEVSPPEPSIAPTPASDELSPPEPSATPTPELPPEPAQPDSSSSLSLAIEDKPKTEENTNALPPSSSDQKQTSENLTYAGFWIRFGAIIIDQIILGIIFAFLSLIPGLDLLETNDGYMEYDATAIMFMIAYYVGFTGSPMQASPGKRLAGIYVMREDGHKITYIRALARHLATYLSTLTLLIGYVMVAFTKQKTGLHDLVAGTRVVYGQPDPAKEDNGEIRHMSIREILLVVVIIILPFVGCGLLGYWALTSTVQLSRTSDTFFKAIHDDDSKSAYAHLSQEFKPSVEEQYLLDFMENNKLDEVVKSSWEKKLIKNDDGFLEGYVYTQSGDRFDIQINLVRNEYEWTIDSILMKSNGEFTKLKSLATKKMNKNTKPKNNMLAPNQPIESPDNMMIEIETEPETIEMPPETR